MKIYSHEEVWKCYTLLWLEKCQYKWCDWQVDVSKPVTVLVLATHVGPEVLILTVKIFIDPLNPEKFSFVLNISGFWDNENFWQVSEPFNIYSCLIMCFSVNFTTMLMCFAV